MRRWLLAVAVGSLGLRLIGAEATAPLGPGRQVGPAGFARVIAGAVVTQGFGCTTLALEPFDPACPSRHFHSGIDLAAPYGTPVFAAGPGLAQVVDDPGGYGLHVVLQDTAVLETIYAHLAGASVTTGQSVRAGQQVGLEGQTGLATGPHLHFEIRYRGEPVDPTLWLPVLEGLSG